MKWNGLRLAEPVGSMEEELPLPETLVGYSGDIIPLLRVVGWWSGGALVAGCTDGT